MNFARQVSRTLDEEHRVNLDLLARLELVIGRQADDELPRLARQLARHLDEEVPHHFAFEEEQLFPRMVESGDGDLAMLLAEEHVALLEVANELLPLARAVADSPVSARDMAAFKRLSLELAERLTSHIQKETMGLLPLVDDLLDEDTDRELVFAYSGA